MESDYDQACYVFGDVVDRMFLPLITITNTYRYVSRAIDAATPQIVLEDVDDFGAHAMDPRFIRYFTNRQEILDRSYRQRVGGVVHGELQAAKRRVASSSLVFAHAVFEECISDCLRIAFLASPKDWLPLVRAKKVSLCDIEDHGVSATQKDAIQSLIAVLERDSILKKLDKFFEVTRPTEFRGRIADYEYSRARIEKMDRARHTAAHDDPTAYDPELLKDDVDYMRLTLMYLLAILIEKYGVRNMLRPDNV